MGTSSSYTGPGRSPLLPPWLDEAPLIQPDDNIDHDERNNDTAQSEPTPTINTGALRSSRTNFRGNASGGDGSLQKAISEYVRAHRKPRYATRASSAGRHSTASLGGFLSNVVRHGISQTLHDLNLFHVIGKSVNEAVSAILNAIAPSGNTREDAIARRALATTLEELYNEFTLDGGIEKLDQMTEADVKGALRSSVANYIFQRFVHLAEVALQEDSVTPDHAVKAENDAREYIREAVRVDFGHNDILHMNWDSIEVSNMIEDIFTKTHIILETVSS